MDFIHTESLTEPFIKEEAINEQNDDIDKKVQYKKENL